ncbi:MAG: hypothetical protein ACYTG5_05660 [Planctomycetota bacterium]|jgi:hypothetical protein
MRRYLHHGSSLAWAALAVLFLASTSVAQSDCSKQVDLAQWRAETYPADSALPTGGWGVGTGGESATQANISNPTFFVSDSTAQSYEISGTLEVISGVSSADGMIGFAIGFDPGDSTNPDAEYYLIDWKNQSDFVDFGDPSCTSGSLASQGLKLSRVFGIPTADELWGHKNEDAACSDLDNGVEELDKGMTKGESSWTRNVTYDIRVVVLPELIEFYVDGTLEFSHAGENLGSRFAFYNFNQDQVIFSLYETTDLASTLEYGEATPGCVAAPTVSLSAPPVLMTYVDIEVDSGEQDTTHGCLLVSTGAANIPTHLGFDLLIDWSSKVLIPLDPLPPQTISFTFPIPPDEVLCGLNFYMQVFHFDSCAPLGVASSRGLSVYLGAEGDTGGG